MKTKILFYLFFILLSFQFPFKAQVVTSELVPIRELIPNIVLDLKYASTDNVFNNQKLYTTNECYVLKDLAIRLMVIQDSLNKIRTLNGRGYPEGIGLKIWDGYRPRAIQYIMFEIFPDPTFVAHPASGSGHNRGGAVDLTLINLATGGELPMPTDFDDFSDAASHNYPSNLLHANVVFNRDFLKSIMTQVGGLDYYSAEWWHYQLSNNKDYPLLDFQMK